jgi:hypothetical protein
MTQYIIEILIVIIKYFKLMAISITKSNNKVIVITNNTITIITNKLKVFRNK